MPSQSNPDCLCGFYLAASVGIYLGKLHQKTQCTATLAVVATKVRRSGKPFCGKDYAHNFRRKECATKVDPTYILCF
jgi:hypothetical protein